MDGAMGIAVDGNHAYISAFRSDSVAVVDISTTSSPILAGQLIDAANMNGAKGIAVDGNYAYLAVYYSDDVAVVDI